MIRLLGKNWWLLLLRGVAALLFGLAALFWPEITLVSLVILFGAFVVVDGIFSLAAAFRERGVHPRWWVVLLEGLIGLTLGGATLAWPEITALVLIYLAASWAVLTGVLEILAALALREELRGEWLLALIGLASVLIGVVLFAQPGAGMVAVSWLIGVYALIFGLLMIALSWKMRSLLKRDSTPGSAGS